VGKGEQFVSVDSQTFVFRDVATGEVRSTIPYPSTYLQQRAVSLDGSRLAVMGYGQLYIWNTASWGKPAQVNCTSMRPFSSLAFHPTRPILAAAQYRQRMVKFLDTDSGKVVSKFNWKIGIIRSVAFSADGALAAAGSDSGKIVVWDVDV
jgi:WD40 repeat protein